MQCNKNLEGYMDNINWDELRKAVKEIEESNQNDSDINKADNTLMTDNDFDQEYALRGRLLAYARQLGNSKIKTPEIRKMQDSIMNGYYLIYDNKVLKVIKNDIEEMERCYQVQAYKSTVIIAGSVLEAFLLDWLSEKDNINYFEKNYYISELKTYIDDIPELHRSDELFKNTNKIRKMRNLVHPKRYFENKNEINAETTKRIMGYLNDVIEARNDELKKIFS